MKQIVVIYHADCPDGFGGAWAAWKVFGERATYLPQNHQRPLPPGLAGKMVYLIDFSYPLSFLKKLAKVAGGLVLIDHHKTAKEGVRIVKDSLFDLTHSGAVLAWKYFHKKKPVPRLLMHIEDRDLWKFKLAFTREILTVFDITPHTFKKFDAFDRALRSATQRLKIIHKGKDILQYQHRLVEEIVGRAQRVRFVGRIVLAVNSPIFESEIGQVLVTRHPPFAIIWHHNRNNLKVSLRSNGKIDVSRIAMKYGGGGHPAAAGFRLPIDSPLPWRYLKSE